MPTTRLLTRRAVLKLAATLATLPVAGTSRPVDHATAQSNWRITGPQIDVLNNFDAVMMDFMQTHDIPGGALALTWQGQLLTARGFNRSDDNGELVVPTSLFRMASLSKPLTATAVLQLIEQRLLTLDTRIVNLLAITPYTDTPRDPRWEQVTVRHLLQHSAGFDRRLSFDPMFHDEEIADALGGGLPIALDDIIAFVAAQPLDFDPGTREAYSNFGYALLGRVVEAVTGRSYAQTVQENVLAPLGITRMQLGRTLPTDRLPGEVRYYSSSSSQPRVNVVNPAGDRDWAYGGYNLENLAAAAGWVGSVVDYARFATAFDRIFESPILSGSSIQTMFAVPRFGLNEFGYHYGCGWYVRPMEGWVNTWHFGTLAGGFTLVLRRWDGMDWVVAFNQRRRRGDSNASYYDIDWMLYDTAASLTTVPDHDLFTTYL